MPIKINIVGIRNSGKTRFIAEYVKRNNFNKVIYVSPICNCSKFYQMLSNDSFQGSIASNLYKTKNIVAIPIEMIQNVLNDIEFEDSLLVIFDDVYEQEFKEIKTITYPSINRFGKPIDISFITTYQILNTNSQCDYTVILKNSKESQLKKICKYVVPELQEKLFSLLKNMDIYDIILLDHNNAKINYFPTSEYVDARFDSIFSVLSNNNNLKY